MYAGSSTGFTPGPIRVKRGEGPEGAKVMLVGEAWGTSEEEKGMPFAGASGQLLNQMLHEAGIMRSECYVTNVVNARPPYGDLTKWVAKNKKAVTKDHINVEGKMVLPVVGEGMKSLASEVAMVKPNIIVAFGGLAMWALTGQEGILKWRGSQLEKDGLKILPTIHPSAVLREYALRPTVVQDLRRASRFRGEPGPWSNVPKWNFIIRPSITQVLETIDMLYQQVLLAPVWVDFDLETSPVHITCAGISWSRTDALCIPFAFQNGDHYWSNEEEEGTVVWHLWRLLTHPNCWVRGQNLLYDAQHTYRWWHWVPNVKQDTMISHHSMFSGMKKSLDYQASLYCDYYQYWKELHKDSSNKAGA